MSMYLLDTCTISDFFSGRGKTQEHLRRVSPANVAVSTITIMEVQYGFELNPSAKRRFSVSFQSLISVAKIIPFNAAAAEVAASIREYLKLQGTPIGGWDLLIGATALVNECILVTSNMREFERIEGLIVDDWR